MERRLGRGLGSLLGGLGAKEDADGTQADAGAPGADGSGPNVDAAPPAELPVERVRPNPDQPRRVFDQKALTSLMESVREHGVLQPVCVRPVHDGYELISGERRWRAAREAGLASIPVVIREVDDRELLELALVENVQREDLDPIEKALAFQQMGELGMTQARIAERVGLERSSVANHLRLLDLPAPVQEGIAKGMISMGHAKALLSLPTDSARVTMFGRIVRAELSVRRTEDLVRQRQEKKKASAKKKPSGPAWARDIEGRLREHFGAEVAVRNAKKGYAGQIVLHYHDREELDRFLETLLPDDSV